MSKRKIVTSLLALSLLTSGAAPYITQNDVNSVMIAEAASSNQVQEVVLAQTNYTYTGKAVTLKIKSIRIGGTTFQDDMLKTLKYSISATKSAVGNNYTATVTVKNSAGTLIGTYQVKYNIVPISITNCTISLSKIDYDYTGSACKPTVTLKTTAGVGISSSYYNVSYSNNTKIGVATVTVTPKNVTGSPLKNDSKKKTTQFTINLGRTSGISFYQDANDSVRVDYNKVPGATHYEIKMSASPNFPAGAGKTITSLVETTSTKFTHFSATLPNANKNTTYYVSVTPIIIKDNKYQNVGTTVTNTYDHKAYFLDFQSKGSLVDDPDVQVRDANDVYILQPTVTSTSVKKNGRLYRQFTVTGNVYTRSGNVTVNQTLQSRYTSEDWVKATISNPYHYWCQLDIPTTFNYNPYYCCVPTCIAMIINNQNISPKIMLDQAGLYCRTGGWEAENIEGNLKIINIKVQALDYTTIQEFWDCSTPMDYDPLVKLIQCMDKGYLGIIRISRPSGYGHATLCYKVEVVQKSDGSIDPANSKFHIRDPYTKDDFWATGSYLVNTKMCKPNNAGYTWGVMAIKKR